MLQGVYSFHTVHVSFMLGSLNMDGALARGDHRQCQFQVVGTGDDSGEFFILTTSNSQPYVVGSNSFQV